jgi:hypothetical protein
MSKPIARRTTTVTIPRNVTEVQASRSVAKPPVEEEPELDEQPVKQESVIAKAVQRQGLSIKLSAPAKKEAKSRGKKQVNPLFEQLERIAELAHKNKSQVSKLLDEGVAGNISEAIQTLHDFVQSAEKTPTATTRPLILSEKLVEFFQERLANVKLLTVRTEGKSKVVSKTDELLLSEDCVALMCNAACPKTLRILWNLVSLQDGLLLSQDGTKVQWQASARMVELFSQEFEALTEVDKKYNKDKSADKTRVVFDPTSFNPARLVSLKLSYDIDDDYVKENNIDLDNLVESVLADHKRFQEHWDCVDLQRKQQKKK